jgi:hypothetical protein
MATKPPFFCVHDSGSFGESIPCNKPTPGDGRDYCADHRARLPLWPVNDDGTPCAPASGGH